MKSSAPGAAISRAEVLAVVPAGIWLGVEGAEHFMPFADFPWFRRAPASAVKNVRLVRGKHLRWPDLDVDLELDSIIHPGHYPLKARAARPARRRGA